MCEAHPLQAPMLNRRAMLQRVIAPLLPAFPYETAAATHLSSGSAVVRDVAIVPRSEWGGDLRPRGDIQTERAENVRFLLVHHSVNANTYAEGSVVGLLREIYAFHTAQRGWADVAYNFFVDRFGRVFEGRTGSLDGPVIGDATGGNQGFDQLCCFLGDHRTEPPTEAAQGAMVALLATLADRYEIDTSPGAQVTFVSRGSNKWNEGTEVTTATIAGHRDMSTTECPGDAAYALVRDAFPQAVTANRAPVVTVPPAQTSTTRSPALTTAPVAPASTTPTSPQTEAAAPSGHEAPGGGLHWRTAMPVTVGLGGLGALIALRARRSARRS